MHENFQGPNYEGIHAEIIKTIFNAKKPPILWAYTYIFTGNVPQNLVAMYFPFSVQIELSGLCVYAPREHKSKLSMAHELPILFGVVPMTEP